MPSTCNEECSAPPAFSPHPTGTRRRRKKNVLILGGWSPGPLPYLESAFYDRCTFLYPEMHMPPAGCNWCLTWEWVGLCVSVGISGWLLSSTDGWKVAVGSLLLLASVPFWIVMLVRGSIRRSVVAAREVIIEARSGGRVDGEGEGGIDLVVGFSWGGGAACWLMEEEERFGGALSSRQPTLLLAPTVFAMSYASRLPRPLFEAAAAGAKAVALPNVGGKGGEEQRARKGGRGGGGGASPLRRAVVEVFHPSTDPFCPPGQVMYFRERGVEVRLVRDSHLLDGPQTVDRLMRSFADLLDMSEDNA